MLTWETVGEKISFRRIRANENGKVKWTIQFHSFGQVWRCQNVATMGGGEIKRIKPCMMWAKGIFNAVGGDGLREATI